MDYYLKFKDEAQATSVLDGIDAYVDVIGEIPDVKGWHVNVRSAEEQEWLDVYDTKPNSPYRVWA